MRGKNRIVVQFRTAEGDMLAISIPRSETAVIRHFQERMPYGLFVPDVQLTRRRKYSKSTGMKQPSASCVL